LVYIDDYAHHPRDWCSLSGSNWYIPIKCFSSFQPHLFSRTRDFADEFAKSLSRFEVILMDIYPARELPIKGITSEWLLDKIDNKHRNCFKTGLNKDHFRN
jgi:UDP-N-acetylmuramate--alanine ligase